MNTKRLGSNMNFLNTNIVRLELKDGFTIAHMSDGGKMRLANSIDELEQELKDVPFIRVHPCHLVNHKYLKSIDSEKKLIAVLSSGETLPADNRLVMRKKWWKGWLGRCQIKHF